MLRHLPALIIIIQLQDVITTSHPKRSAFEALVVKHDPNISTNLVTTHHDIANVPAVYSVVSTNEVPSTTSRKMKGPNIPLSVPITHQLLIPKLHDTPARSKVQQSSVHTDIKHIVTKDNVKIPVISQSVSHTVTDITHPTPLVPILVPLHSSLVPAQDLSVIPLRKSSQKVLVKSQARSGAERSDGDESMNGYRNFFGGYGNGLLFGGHGAGHGFYAAYHG